MPFIMICSERIVSPNTVLALAAGMIQRRLSGSCGLSKAAFACNLVFLGWNADFSHWKACLGQ